MREGSLEAPIRRPIAWQDGKALPVQLVHFMTVLPGAVRQAMPADFD